MAKPIGPKSMLIRNAIAANPGKGNTELAEIINFSERANQGGVTVTAMDVAQQKQALAGELESLKKQASALEPRKAYIGKFRSPDEVHLLKRGEVMQPMEVVSPGALSRDAIHEAYFGH